MWVQTLLFVILSRRATMVGLFCSATRPTGGWKGRKGRLCAPCCTPLLHGHALVLCPVVVMSDEVGYQTWSMLCAEKTSSLMLSHVYKSKGGDNQTKILSLCWTHDIPFGCTDRQIRKMYWVSATWTGGCSMHHHSSIQGLFGAPSRIIEVLW